MLLTHTAKKWDLSRDGILHPIQSVVSHSFLHQNDTKRGKSFFDQWTQCTPPIHWLEYATQNKGKTIIAPATVTEKTAEFFESTDPIKEFLSEQYIITDDKNDRIKSSDLLRSFNSINKEIKLTAQSLAAAMKFNKIERVKNSVYYYVCLKLKPEESEPCHLELSTASCK